MMRVQKSFAFGFVCLLGMLAAGVTTTLAASPRNSSHPALGKPSTVGKAPLPTQPQGVWGAPVELGMISIHMAVLHTGKVLFWGTATTGKIGCCTVAKVLDPVTGTITDVTQPFDADVICAAQTVLPDGRVITAGGEAVILGHGITTTTLFDPIAQTWSMTGNMTAARWYPTDIQMPDGTALVTTGLDETHMILQRLMESYNPATGVWTPLPASANLPDTSPGYTYQHLFLLPSGKMMEAGPWKTTSLYDPATQSWSTIGNMNLGDRYHAAAVLLPNLEQVLIAGGTPVNVEGSSTASATTELIDLSQTTPTWQYGTSMNLARYNENLVYLADGTLLAVGGGTGPTKYAGPVLQSELYDPTTQQWTLMATQQANRTYHSNAALLPDGRAISSGSTNGTTQAHTYEIYNPPYLYKGARPTYTGGSAMIHYGKTFTLQTTSTNITKVALIRPSANTHANDMDQRYVPLTFTQGSGSLTITAPANANYAPPGYYMLVIVNANGVPSKMRFVKIS